MPTEDWSKIENERLRTEVAELQGQQKREDIWSRAFFDPDDKWRFSPVLEEEFRNKGFLEMTAHSHSQFARVNENSEFNQWARFKQKLLRGACEYLESTPPKDNRITAIAITNVLQSHPKFGNNINIDLVHRWLFATRFGKTILDDFAIDRTIIDATKRYVHAIRKWWESNPKAVNLSYSDIALMLHRSENAIRVKINRTPELQELVKNKPHDV